MQSTRTLICEESDGWRLCYFHAVAKRIPGGMWRVHMHADYVASVTSITQYPFSEMTEMWSEWMTVIEARRVRNAERGLWIDDDLPKPGG